MAKDLEGSSNPQKITIEFKPLAADHLRGQAEKRGMNPQNYLHYCLNLTRALGEAVDSGGDVYIKDARGQMRRVILFEK